MNKNKILNYKNYAKYSRDDVWEICYPGTKRPKGGNWDTGYTRLKPPLDNVLIVFMNIGIPGLTGHNFPNNFDADLNEIIWYGKPDTHSDQPLMKELIKGNIKPLFFARYDNKVREFDFLGQGVIKSFRDNFKVPYAITSYHSTIEFIFTVDGDVHNLESAVAGQLEEIFDSIRDNSTKTTDSNFGNICLKL
jgi:hypothetical protein